MFDYSLVGSNWVVTSKAKVSYKSGDLVMAILDFVHDNIRSAHADEVFVGSNATLHHFSQRINYGKDKSGKAVETPDFYRAAVVSMMDKAQSAVFSLAVEKAKNFYDPFDAKQQKEIYKYADAMLANFNAMFEGKGAKPLPELPTQPRVKRPYVNPVSIWSAIKERDCEAIVVGFPDLSVNIFCKAEDVEKLSGIPGVDKVLVREIKS